MNDNTGHYSGCGSFSVLVRGCVFLFRGMHKVRDDLQLSNFVG